MNYITSGKSIKYKDGRIFKASVGYLVNFKPCSECKSFKNLGFGQIPICTKKLMGVSSDLHAQHKIGEPCFEQNKN